MSLLDISLIDIARSLADISRGDRGRGSTSRLDISATDT